MDSVVEDTAGVLLAAVADGDRQAFAELYDLLSAAVFGLVMRVIGRRALSEEVMQDAFLMVWQQAGSFSASRGSARSWVYLIAHRRAVDCVRRTQASFTRDCRAGFKAIEHDRDVVAESVDGQDDVAQLRVALTGLSRKQRSFLSLAYYGGHTHTEIASMTDTPLGTVKTTLRDAVAALRKRMAVPVVA